MIGRTNAIAKASSGEGSVNDAIYYIDIYDAFTSPKYRILKENYEDTNIQIMDDLLTKVAGE